VVVIGIDAGGTEIKAGLLQGGEILESERFPTGRESGAYHAQEQVLLAAETMHKKFPQAQAIGLVVPGVVDADAGIARYSENIGWRDVHFGKMIHDMTGLPVGFGHDVRAGGIAESIYGASKGHANSLFMPIGTGIAGAMIMDGRLFDDPYAGEIGHLNVGSAYGCNCGSHGCLETVATGPSITRIYNERSGRAIGGSQEVLTAAKSGDTVAQEVWAEATQAIGIALMAYINIVAPELIVIGGGLSRAGADLINPIVSYIDAHLTFQRKPNICVAALGDSAGMIGAGILAVKALG
jgi:glucokinase